MRKIVIPLAMLLLGSCALTAQSQILPAEIGLRYAAQVSNGPAGSCGCFVLQGGAADAAWKLLGFKGASGLALAADIGSVHTGSVNGAPYGMTVSTFLAGPRLVVPMKHTHVFGQVLLGEAHGSGSQFPKDGALTASADSFAFDAGGAIDLALAPHLSLRILQADYLRTSFPNNTTNWQNNLRIGAGIAVHFR